MNPKITAIMVIGLFVGAGALVWFAGGGRLPDPLAIIQGYGGMNAETTDVIASNYDESYGPYGSHIHKTVLPTSASFDVDANYVLEAFDPTGVKMEISGALNVLSREVIDTVSKWEVDETAHTNTTKTVQVNKVKCSMGVGINTFGYGVAAINNVVFTVRLSENSVNVFQGADDSIAYILLVETIDKAKLNNIIDVVPLGTGYTFPLDTVKSVPAPAWITEAGYSGQLSDLKVVQFQITVVTAQPLSFAGVKTYESSAELQIGVDVLQFGFWKQVKDYNPYGLPDWGPLQWLYDLLVAIGAFLAIIIGVVITVVILVKVKRPRLAIVAVVILWAALAFFLGWLDPFLGGLTDG